MGICTSYFIICQLQCHIENDRKRNISQYKRISNEKLTGVPHKKDYIEYWEKNQTLFFPSNNIN